MRILRSFNGLLDRIFVVIGAFLGCQIPEFVQQYTQRLAGHVDELQRLLTQIRQIASYSHRTLEEYIAKFSLSSDPDFVHQGQFMQGILERWQTLNQALVELTQSSIWLRPYVFFKGLQPDIAKSTFKDFQPGLNLSIEGFFYAGLGMLLGWTLYRLVSMCILLGYSNAAKIFKSNS